MHYFRNIVNVFDGTQQLFEIISRKQLAETAFCILNFYVRKQVSLFNQLEYNEVNLDGLSRFLVDDFSLYVVFDKLNDIWVVHFLQQSHFVQKNLLEHFQIDFLDMVTFDYFYRIKLVTVLLTRRQLHLRIQTAPDCLQQLVVVDRRLAYFVAGQFKAAVDFWLLLLL